VARKPTTIAIALAVAASVSPAASASVLPRPVAHAIVRRVNAPYRYVPGYLPAGDRFWRWESHSRRDLVLRFRQVDGLEDIVFTVGNSGPFSSGGNCGAWHGTVFRLSGVVVRWAATVEDQDAWRCLRSRNGNLIVVAAHQSNSARGASNPASHWARSLARIVASAHRFG
jgi:hypothetical protein